MKKRRNRWQRRPFIHHRKGFHPSGMKLSLCMIVKDEARNIEDCIRPVGSVVDEIIVVDTGSTDRTKEIAKELGAKVFEFPWCDDFSAVRNESIRHATGDYILWLDADDRMDEPELDKVKRLKKILSSKKDKAYYFIVKSDNPTEGETHFLQLRVFPKVEGALFEGKIHEQIFRNLMRHGVDLVQTDIVIRHTGYFDRDVIFKKANRNLRIIKNELESDPKNLLLHFNAARTLTGLGKWEEAVSHMEKITGNETVKEKEKHLFHQASILLGQYYIQLKLYDKATSLFERLSNETERDGFVFYYLGKALFLAKNYRGAIEALRQSLQVPLSVNTFPVNFDELRYDQHYMLGQCYMEIGETATAKKILMESLGQCQHHSKSLEALGDLSLKSQTFKEAVDFYKKAIAKGRGSDQNYSNLGLACRKLGLWKEAESALTTALEINPERIEALINLGYLYYDLEEGTKALPFFTKALSINPDLTDVRLTLSEIYFLRYDLDALVEQCDALLKGLALPRDICLESLKDLACLYERMGEVFLEKRRNILSLMTYHLSFLIHPSKGMMDRIISMAKEFGVFETSFKKIEKALAFHNQPGRETPLFEAVSGRA